MSDVEWKVGDKVEYLRGDKLYRTKGKIYEVYAVDDMSCCEEPVKILDDSGDYVWVDIKSIKKVASGPDEPTKEWKVGDKFKYISDTSERMTQDKIYEAFEVDNNLERTDMPVRCINDIGDSMWVHKFCILKVEPEPDVEWKVGDKVEYIGPDNSMITRNKIYDILKINNNDDEFPVTIMNNNGVHLSMHPTNIKKVESDVEWAVGDKFRCISDEPVRMTKGKIYEVLDYDPDDKEMPVRCIDDLGDKSWVHGNKIKKIDNKGEEAMKYKIGDKVRYQGSIINNMTYEKNYDVIDCDDSDIPVRVVADDDSKTWLHKDVIYKVFTPEFEAGEKFTCMTDCVSRVTEGNTYKIIDSDVTNENVYFLNDDDNKVSIKTIYIIKARE